MFAVSVIFTTYVLYLTRSVFSLLRAILHKRTPAILHPNSSLSYQSQEGFLFRFLFWWFYYLFTFLSSLSLSPNQVGVRVFYPLWFNGTVLVSFVMVIFLYVNSGNVSFVCTFLPRVRGRHIFCWGGYYLMIHMSFILSPFFLFLLWFHIARRIQTIDLTWSVALHHHVQVFTVISVEFSSCMYINRFR